MPRKIKCRRVCCIPENRIFTPETDDADFITIYVDELEAIRLCDLEGLDQDTAAGRMNVSRGTFQRILYAVRRKSADALCTGKGILIDGGNYKICENKKKCINTNVRKCKKCTFDVNERGEKKDE
jgi:predicted DNA-binding protein (UPF0251 family)